MLSKKLPKINFIGNKEKIASWICSKFPKKKIEIYINELSDWIELNSKNFNKYELSLFHIRFLIFKLKIKNFLKKMGV